MMRLNLLFSPRNRRSMAECLKRTIVVSFPFFNQTAAYCTAAATTIPTQTTTLSDWETIKGNRAIGETQAFANQLLRQERLYDHLEVSPSSFHLILSLLTAGAGGLSRLHFLKLFFGIDSMQDLDASVSLLQDVLLADRPDSPFGPRIRSSTSVWHHHSVPLDPSFLSYLHHPYRASVLPVDFHKIPLARQQINSRVACNTNGLIKDLICEESLGNSSVELVLTNTLHFKADWDIYDDTQHHLAESGKCHNPYARLGYDHDWAESYLYHSAKKYVGAEIIAMKRNIIGDVICLANGDKFRRPSKDKRHFNLTYCYPRHMDAETLDTSDCLISEETLMEVGGRELPKLNVSSEVDASKTLRTLGIILPFSLGGLMDMISPSDSDLYRELYLFKIFQKTFIDLNEQGSEAATATTAIVMSGCPPHLPRVCYLDKIHYGPDILHACGGLMARLGIQVHQHV